MNGKTICRIKVKHTDRPGTIISYLFWRFFYYEKKYNRRRGVEWNCFIRNVSSSIDTIILSKNYMVRQSGGKKHTTRLRIYRYCR